MPGEVNANEKLQNGEVVHAGKLGEFVRKSAGPCRVSRKFTLQSECVEAVFVLRLIYFFSGEEDSSVRKTLSKRKISSI